VVREDGQMFYTTQGVHTLCVDKVGNSLVLKRWSYSAHRSKVWTSLRFQSWEELVLFHCTFMSLKAHNTLTNLIDEKEYSIAGEKRLFQAYVRFLLVSSSCIAMQTLGRDRSRWFGLADEGFTEKSQTTGSSTP
jgi:hypothetical protein